MSDKQSDSDDQPLSKIHEYKVLIRESHLDTFGHVNNATYLVLFEEARWDIITAGGYGLAKVQESEIGPTILEINLKFRREILLRQTITIRSWVSQNRGKVQTLRQVMLDEKGEEACIADFAIGLFDLKARKLILPTPEWRTAMGML